MSRRYSETNVARLAWTRDRCSPKTARRPVLNLAVKIHEFKYYAVCLSLGGQLLAELTA